MARKYSKDGQVWIEYGAEAREDGTKRPVILIRERGYQHYKWPQHLTPDRASEYERIWQHGLSECLRWRLTEEGYREAQTDMVLVEGRGFVKAQQQIANKLQSHFAFLTYTVAGRYAADNDLNNEQRHELWRFCWERLNRLLLDQPSMPEWLLELALESGVERHVEGQPVRVAPVAPELETPLATQLLKAGREWDVAAHKIEAYRKDEKIGERGIGVAIGKSKTTVHNALDRIERRARRIGVMP
jgi:hypothetical protein